MNYDRREFLRAAAITLGGMVSASCAAVIQNRDPALPFEPEGEVFAPSERHVLEAVVDRILPTTETPGAVDVGVLDFVEFMIEQAVTDAEANAFAQGLRRLDEIAAGQSGTDSVGFADLAAETQDEILRQLEADELAATGGYIAAALDSSVERPFFMKARELTVVGYFTSEQVATQQFEFAHAAGSYDGCVTLGPGARPWYGGQ